MTDLHIAGEASLGDTLARVVAHAKGNLNDAERIALAIKLYLNPDIAILQYIKKARKDGKLYIDGVRIS